MPGRFGSSDSRWSSERERQERERLRKEFDAKRGTPPRRSSWREGSSGSAQPPQESDSPIRERRASEPPPSPPDEEIRPATVGRKWRDSVSSSPPDDGSSLPPLPGDDNGTGGESRSGKGLLVFGLVLFILMAVLAFTPLGPLGSDNDGEEPTEIAVVPTSPVQDPSSRGILSSTPTPPPLDESAQVVCIDPGHGGWDLGRQRMDQDEYDPPYFIEAEINLAMGLMLRDELESRGVHVVMTRETGTAANVYGEDVNGDGWTIRDGEQHGDRDELQRRIDICNEANADVLVSLHLNGFDDPSARGYEVLYTLEREFGEQNVDLAELIYREIGRAYNDLGFETTARGTKNDTEDLDAETHEFGSEQHLVLTGPAVNNPDYSIVPSEMPGVFIEPVFVTNQDDANFIVNPDSQRRLVVAYADGIENFLDRQSDD